MTASQSLTTGDLRVGVAPGLDVAGEPDRGPARAVAVAAVLGGAVRALARVLVDELAEAGDGVEAALLLGPVDGGEVGTERGDAVPVLLLPPRHRAVPLPLRMAGRALDAGAPGQLLERTELVERREPGLATEAAREGAAGEDPGRVDQERAEQAVDVVGATQCGGPGVPVGRRDQPLARGFDDGEVGRREVRGRGGHRTGPYAHPDAGVR